MVRQDNAETQTAGYLYLRLELLRRYTYDSPEHPVEVDLRIARNSYTVYKVRNRTKSGRNRRAARAGLLTFCSFFKTE